MGLDSIDLTGIRVIRTTLVSLRGLASIYPSLSIFVRERFLTLFLFLSLTADTVLVLYCVVRHTGVMPAVSFSSGSPFIQCTDEFKKISQSRLHQSFS
jgi:hypothetical protein